LDDFLVAELPIKRKIMTLVKIFAPVGQVESECSLVSRPRETPLFSRGEEVDLLFRPQSRRWTLCIINVL